MDATEQDQSKSNMLDMAITDMKGVLEDMSDLFQKLKRAKFDYLSMTCELYTKVDLPSIMMDNCDRDVKDLVPTPDNIRKTKF